MRILGVFMMALPVILIAAYVLIEEGLKGFVVIFGGSALIIGCILGGCYLAER